MKRYWLILIVGSAAFGVLWAWVCEGIDAALEGLTWDSPNRFH